MDQLQTVDKLAEAGHRAKNPLFKDMWFDKAAQMLYGDIRLRPRKVM